MSHNFLRYPVLNFFATIRFCLFTVLTVLVWQVGFSATSPMIQNNAFTYTAAPHDALAHTIMLGGYRAYNPKTGEFLKQDSDTPFMNRKTLKMGLIMRWATLL